MSKAPYWEIRADAPFPDKGDLICRELSKAGADKAAQRHANVRGEPVIVYYIGPHETRQWTVTPEEPTP